MKTAYCPKGHKELGSGSAGSEYGHVPGHQYHDVDVVISCIAYADVNADTSQGTRCHVCESWGSAQGCDEENGRREVVSHGSTISEVVLDARQRAVRRGIEGLASEYLEEALSKAEDEALNSFVCTEIKKVPAGSTVAVHLTADEIDELFDAINDSIMHWEMCDGDDEENARYARTIAGLRAIERKLVDVRGLPER